MSAIRYILDLGPPVFFAGINQMLFSYNTKRFPGIRFRKGEINSYLNELEPAAIAEIERELADVFDEYGYDR